MLALLAAVVFAQSHVAVQVGKEKQDSITRAKSDSIAFRRDQVRDSLRARERVRDSVRREIRFAKRLPVTPAVMASAFKEIRNPAASQPPSPPLPVIMYLADLLVPT